jgi:diguanylate cyclase
MEIMLNRILIVDDNKDIHEDIKYILNAPISKFEYMETQLLKNELFGEEDAKIKNSPYSLVRSIQYKIDDAYQGEEAIKMVETAKLEGYPYSLIFMDVRMPPGIDGIQSIGHIWEMEPCTEVVICTAYSDYSWDQILSKLGQNDHLLFLKKPFDNVSVKQIALSLTTKWNLQRQNRLHIENLESEVEIRTQELKTVIEKLTVEMSLREEREKQLAYSAHYDSLTGLLNRRSFYSSISSILNNNMHEAEPFALFFLDIDGFKSVNDALGHDIGDLLLIEISSRIQLSLTAYAYSLRETGYTTDPVNAVFRLGGDEFTCIISEGDKEKIKLIAIQLLKGLSEPFIILNHDISISCSVGISMYPQDATSANLLLKYADTAMYKAKKNRGIYVFHDEFKEIEFLIENGLEHETVAVLDKKQIDLYYQCLITPHHGIIGIQALVRWIHPERGILSPESFIEFAQNSDRMIVMGEYILKTACMHLKKLHQSGYDELFVLVNCTAKQFFNPNFINIVTNSLNEVELDPRFLKIGLEEKLSVNDTKASLIIISELNKIGIQFTIDGFGSNYPTFIFLQQVPKNAIIRANKSSAENIISEPQNQYFLHAVLDIIKNWNLNVIISGLETPEQKILLIQKDSIL